MPLTQALPPRLHMPWARLEVCVLFVLSYQKPPVDVFVRVLRVYIGPVKTAPLNILGYTVPNQAYSAPLAKVLTSRIRVA